MSKSEQSIVRANAILQLLKNTDRSLHNLALICNVSVRTIQRDVNYLTSLGCPIVMDSETKEYRLVNDPGIPPINFTQSEVLAIMVLFSQFGGQIEEPIFAAAQTAILKFASFIPPNLLKAFCKIGPYMQIQPKKPISTSIITKFSTSFCSLCLIEESSYSIITASPNEDS